VSASIVWREEAISRRHDRKNFDCGSTELNEYLRRYARQNHESGGAKTFVAVLPNEPARILGYDTISPRAIEFAQVPAVATRRWVATKFRYFGSGDSRWTAPPRAAAWAVSLCSRPAGERFWPPNHFVRKDLGYYCNDALI
jgi:hypothetical protein